MCVRARVCVTIHINIIYALYINIIYYIIYAFMFFTSRCKFYKELIIYNYVICSGVNFCNAWCSSFNKKHLPLTKNYNRANYK